MGKCSYGGLYDDSKDIFVIGGINKEILSLELFFYFDLYQLVGEVVIQVIYDFFVGNGKQKLYMF